MTSTKSVPLFPGLQGQQYIRLTTFRKSGVGVPTPVWFTESDGKLYVFTPDGSGKVKRVRASGRVELAPSDARGNPVGPTASGRARLLPPEDSQRVYRLFTRKYGLLMRLFAGLGRLRGAKAVYLEISPDSGPDTENTP